MSQVKVLPPMSLQEVRRALEELGTAPDGVRTMAPKGVHRLVRLDGVSPVVANILKQEMLSLGGEAALPANIYELQGPAGAAILMGTVKHYRALCRRLRKQGSVFATLAAQIEQALAEDL